MIGFDTAENEPCKVFPLSVSTPELYESRLRSRWESSLGRTAACTTVAGTAIFADILGGDGSDSCFGPPISKVSL